MRTQTHMLNLSPKKCSAYHEAGHAVVGIVNGLRLKHVTISGSGDLDPHCRWDKDVLDPILESGSLEAREAFTGRFAEMSLASRYSEAMGCDITSDEQRDSHHGDYVHAQSIRRKASLDEFGPAMVERLTQRARTLVTQYAAAIKAVAEKLLECDGLDQADIERIIWENPPSGKA
jgi:ATP-dependent Zn protease